MRTILGMFKSGPEHDWIFPLRVVGFGWILGGLFILPIGEQDRFWPEYAAAGWELWELWTIYGISVGVTLLAQPFLWFFIDDTLTKSAKGGDHGST